MKYSYYPGCSLERNAQAYHESATAVAAKLNIEFAEVDDWNCCGATEYMSIDLLPAYALVARNLALATKNGANGRSLVAPCSACFLNLSKTNRNMADSADLAQQVNSALAAGNLHYQPDSVRVRHLLDIFVNDMGLEAIEEKVIVPLHGLRIAPYYGCLIVRPGYDETPYDDPEFPQTLDHLLAILGADVADYSLKTACCGGHMTQISEEVALEMIRRLLKNAAEQRVDLIVTLCPMCQLNLDAYQQNVNRHFGTDFHLPILFFTQVMGLAIGIPAEELGIGQEIVSAAVALDRISDTPPEKPKKKRPLKHALPMPGRRGKDER